MPASAIVIGAMNDSSVVKCRLQPKIQGLLGRMQGRALAHSLRTAWRLPYAARESMARLAVKQPQPSTDWEDLSKDDLQPHCWVADNHTAKQLGIVCLAVQAACIFTLDPCLRGIARFCMRIVSHLLKCSCEEISFSVHTATITADDHIRYGDLTDLSIGDAESLRKVWHCMAERCCGNPPRQSGSRNRGRAHLPWSSRPQTP